MPQALLIINPQSRNGQADALDEATKLLKSSGMTVERCVTESVSHMVSCIEQYTENDSIVIVAGGDGTISSALGAVYRSQHTLAILPMGTANDLARSLGVPLSGGQWALLRWRQHC